eukprot:5483883-Amphidinium_carterae.1
MKNKTAHGSTPQNVKQNKNLRNQCVFEKDNEENHVRRTDKIVHGFANIAQELDEAVQEPHHKRQVDASP